MFGRYKVTVQHDKGIVCINIIASNEATAKSIVETSENCPPNAIVSAVLVKSI